jgi:hypothetical protein
VGVLMSSSPSVNSLKSQRHWSGNSSSRFGRDLLAAAAAGGSTTATTSGSMGRPSIGGALLRWASRAAGAGRAQ